MTVVNIISGIILLLCSIAIVLIIMFTDTDSARMSSAISGGSDSFYGRNMKNTREARLNLVTKIVVGLLYVVCIVVNIIARFAG
ncbi:MAG: preprotein translocase subunit SecG [Oscillospiraceae bacterium]|nr:preprotein translocase subunit SecG [Oscillospiraceae bacterium]